MTNRSATVIQTGFITKNRQTTSAVSRVVTEMIDPACPDKRVCGGRALVTAVAGVPRRLPEGIALPT